jgi:peptidoglycan hydrolase-like protein with peptidoglycan-binding domain
MALQSILFAGDKRLERAAVLDSAHVIPGERGPHVVKIQQSLIDVAGANIVADGVYGPATATAVADFKRKHQPPILNRAAQIDNIVGIKTLAALDARLPQKRGGGLQLDFDVVITLMDVVINFEGAPSSRLRDPDDTLPSNHLKNYAPVTGQDPSNAKLLRHKDTGNLLLRIKHDTAGFGFEGVPVFQAVLNRMNDALKRGDPENKDSTLQFGRIYAFGTSSGARNAMDLVKLLVPFFGVSLHFVAAIDSPFFQADTTDRPVANKEPAEPIPTFRIDPLAQGLLTTVAFERRLNFFQRQGNHTKRVIRPFSPLTEVLYTSKMGGGLEEVHGKVQGMNNREILSGAFGTTDDLFHEFCDAEGRRIVQALVIADLKAE